MNSFTRMAAAMAMAALCAGASAQSVTLNGSMGDRALLIIDGQPRTLAVGATAQGIKLLSLSGDEARVDIGGKTVVLHHGTPVNMGGAGGSSAGGQEIVLTAGLGGHFWTNGTINGKTVRFMVDTGATTIAMGASEADRIGLDYRNGQRGFVNTANGTAPAYRVLLTSVRIGDVEVYNVAATITPAYMDHVLLGNSFLSRFQMKRDNDTMRLEKRP